MARRRPTRRSRSRRPRIPPAPSGRGRPRSGCRPTPTPSAASSISNRPAMGELASLLLHPSRWSELAPQHRILLALLILAASIVLATVLGALTSRWGRRRAEDAGTSYGPIADRIARLRRGLVMLTVVVGGYAAVQTAPLSGRVERFLSGTLYVLGAWLVARLAIHLATVLLATSVKHVPGEDRARIEREYVPVAHKVTSLVVTLILVIVVAKYFG